MYGMCLMLRDLIEVADGVDVICSGAHGSIEFAGARMVV